MRSNYLLYKAAVSLMAILFFGTSVSISSTVPELSENADLFSKQSEVENPIIEITLSNLEFRFGKTSCSEGYFATIEIVGEESVNIVGEAHLPIIRKIVEIPQGATPQISIDAITWEITSLDELDLPSRIVPTQPSVAKNSDADESFIINEEYYLQDILLPTDIAQIVGIGEIRGRRFAHVEISPLQYNPLTGSIYLLESCDLKIILPDSNILKTQDKIQRYSNDKFEQIFRSSFENYGQFGRGDTKDPSVYLIIVHDNFYNQILPFASWKESCGFDVTITRTSEIPYGPTYANIEAYIDDAYYNWPIPPTYILLVGDTDYVPTKTSGLEWGVSCSDLYYAAIDAGNYYPDVYIGRFPASSPTHVAAMVDKTLLYEQDNYPSEEFLTYACFMAGNDNYDISEGTHNWCIEHYLEPNQWQYDKIYEVTYGGTTQDVRDAINDGRILAVFSGHGSSTSWADGPSFSQSDVNGLTNLGEYPFVFSHACSTGTFDIPECFGETWLRATDKAGIFFWGASGSTYWTEDDWLERNWFTAWWDDDLEDIGALTVQGMLYTVEDIGGPYEGKSQYYFEAYNIMGDPSLRIANLIEGVEGDANGDGVVNVEDLLIVLGQWGTTGPEGDVNHDGIVNVEDLLMVLANWTF